MRRSSLAAPLALALLTAGCGGGDEVDVAPTPAGGSAGSLQNSAPRHVRNPFGAAAGRAHRLDLSVDDAGRRSFRYTAPPTVRAGLVEIRLRNVGRAPRKAQLWRVAGDHSVKAALRARTPLPDWLRTAGGVGFVQPGATGRSLQVMRPGLYYVAGTFGEPGRVATFRVTGPAARGRLAPAPARVDTLDFRFEVSGLRAGRNTIELRNSGREQHHAFFVPMVAGATLANVRRFFTTRSSMGAPPVDAERTRETVVLEGGDRQLTQVDLEAGEYALVCIVRGRGGGPPHVELGMINEVTIR